MSKAKTVMHTVEAISHYLLTSAKLKKPIDDNVRNHCVFVLTYQARRLFALLTKQEHHYSTRLAHESHSMDALVKVRNDLGSITGTIDRFLAREQNGSQGSGGGGYDLTAPSVNTVLSEVVGVGGAFHAAVEVYGVEWSYGYCQYGCGVFAVPPTSSEPGSIGTYRECLPVERCRLPVTEVIQILEELKGDWPGSSYDLLHRNCTHFCDVFLRKLIPHQGLIDMEAPPERVTISTVNEEEIMLREWRQMWDAALRRMTNVAWQYGDRPAIDDGIIHSRMDYQADDYRFDRECRSTYELRASVVRLAAAQFALMDQRARWEDTQPVHHSGGSFMKPPVRYPEVQEDARSPKDAGLISYSADRPSNSGLLSFYQALNQSIRRCNEILDVFVPEKPIQECHSSIMAAFKRCEEEANLTYPERDVRVKNLTQFRPAFTSREMEERIREKIERDRLDALEEDKFLPITT
ncbi:hypothetical protein Pmar_PMAR021197 [Perkinsus marinus ATCC 50983]|uniref:PPPDE domain-containing protein n=1 Tax=Perkinsus marinus (strain ATCC 50983 / TXsc) TaxID=423536 RepID=C5KM82_PERM5|nr:hypothetical protein Pmar_PMAR021197 [Perkinsus marinus ATCC 50983]EER14443.1 hypothetical protein Pmar_PMAR021197 [Perkinsus marinus ATCC 50983]|eukprot:XP_002782648.1 hypothetical protein Pmar_PMAR021197 [Perkinsus marinus ATCC 50983]